MITRHLQISTKLILAFSATACVFLATYGAVMLNQSRSVAAVHVSTAAATILDDVDQALAGLHDQNASVRGLILYRLPRYVDKYRAAGALIDDMIANARTVAAGYAAVETSLDTIEKAAKAWQAEIGDRVAAIGPTGRMEDAAAIATSERASVLFNQFRAAVSTGRGQIEAWSGKATAARDHAFRMVRASLVTGALVAVLIMGAAWFWLRRSVAHPIRSIATAMNTLAAGNTDVTLSTIGRRDEVGQMALAVETFRQAAIAKSVLEREAEASRAEADRQRNASAAVTAETAREQALVVSALAEALGRLSDGDLMARLDAAFPTHYDKLRTDFNAAVARLEETMGLVSGNADAIRSSTNEIASAAQDLSRRTEQQAASLEQTAAALEEITQTVKKTAASATRTHDAVTAAKADAEASGTVVRRAVEAMGSIEASSRQIGEIIGVIDEIAFQTNLLALNAGVEAARAGDSGRGFAVVASEVRALAQRSAEAAREIKALISASAGHVQDGVAQVGDAGTALFRIVAQINAISTDVGEIAGSAGEQSTALAEINVAIGQVDVVTQQNAAMVEETTAASKSLASETEALTGLIGRFRVGAGQQAGPSQPRPARGGPPRLAARRQSVAAVQPLALECNDEWEEF
jgi:methyl-accepting chemotaxis protein